MALFVGLSAVVATAAHAESPVPSPSPSPQRQGHAKAPATGSAPSKPGRASGAAVAAPNAALHPKTSATAHETDLPVPAEGAFPGRSAGDASGVSSGGPSPQTPRKSDYAFGAFQRGFYLTAREIAEPLANLGDPAAQTLLGEIYSRGLGVAQDLKEAGRWYKAAAESGNPESQFRYAMMLLDGKDVKQDPAVAKAMMKAAADKGLPLAQYNYAQMLIEEQPSGGFIDAMPYFAKAAASGVPDAQYAMAQLYEYGKGVTASDGQAREWLKEAATSGFTIAQIEYGIWLINGRGGEAKPKEGFRFLKFAAERGNPIAINRVAHLVKDGIGTSPDPLEAGKWTLLAKRVENSDPVLDDFFRGLDAATKKSALEAANRFRSG